MRWIAPFFLLALSACSLHQAAHPSNATAPAWDNGFYKGPGNAEWLASAVTPRTPFDAALSPEENTPLVPRLFPSEYDWPYWLYSVRIADTNRYK